MPTLQEIHEFAVEEGIAADPRDEEQIEDELEAREDQYDELEGVRKDRYDEDRLQNPFDDSKVLYGGDEEVDTVAVGIDIETQDLLLVDRLNEDGEDIDGVITHHPQGRGISGIPDVMELTVDALTNAGIQVSQAEAVIQDRIREVNRGYHPYNHPRTPRAAELLGLPFLCSHTITDNHAYSFMDEYLKDREPYTVEDVIDEMLELEEYQWALEFDAGPEVWSGSEDNRAGDVEVLGFTGGTSPGADAIEVMVEGGVDTLVAMHAKEDQIERAQEHNLNVVVAGHMASDSLGMNLLLDKLQDEFSLDVFELSGFKRVER